MKKRSVLTVMFLAICLLFTSICYVPSTVFAKEITTVLQAKKQAKKKVKGSTVVEVDKDYEKGVLVFEVHLLKGKKEYDLVYRASDAKLISYGWEIKSWYVEAGQGKTISMSKCRKLAKKQVPKGKITSIVKKRSDGIDIYAVKMTKGNKKYELKYHARTKKLLEYDWEYITKTGSSKKYIGTDEAKWIAIKKVGGGTVVKVEFDTDDGVPVYEVEVINGEYEYDIEIHAKTGKILDVDMDHI